MTTSSPKPFPDSLKKSVVELGSVLLVQNQGALVFLATKTRNSVSYSDPEVRNRAQADLDHTVGLLCCAHLLMAFEEYLPSKYWPDTISNEDQERLKAYRHIKRTGLEGLGRTRPKDDYTEFDSVMASDNPIRGVVDHDKKSLVMSPDIFHDLSSFLGEVVNRAVVAVHSR